MSGPLTLGLDVGTQSTKALVYEVESGEVLGRGAISYSVTSQRPGQAEQDPRTWQEACKAAIADALDAACQAGRHGDAVEPQRGTDCAALARRIHAVGISGQQHGLVALDAGGAVIRPGDGMPGRVQAGCALAGWRLAAAPQTKA